MHDTILFTLTSSIADHDIHDQIERLVDQAREKMNEEGASVDNCYPEMKHEGDHLKLTIYRRGEEKS